MVSEVSHFEHSIHVHSDQSAGIDIQLPKHFVQLMTGRLPLLMDFFMHMDAKRTGQVTTEQFCHAVRRFGMSHDEAETVFGAFDQGASGHLSLADFIRMHQHLRQQIHTQMAHIAEGSNPSAPSPPASCRSECDGEAPSSRRKCSSETASRRKCSSERASQRKQSSRINLQLTGCVAPPPPLSDRALSAVPGSRRSSQLERVSGRSSLDSKHRLHISVMSVPTPRSETGDATPSRLSSQTLAARRLVHRACASVERFALWARLTLFKRFLVVKLMPE